jgi:hypothetical protein
MNDIRPQVKDSTILIPIVFHLKCLCVCEWFQADVTPFVVKWVEVGCG